MTHRNIMFVFPGQGSQYVGMGKEFYDEFQEVRDIFDEAGEVLGYDLSDLCFKKHSFGKFMHRAADLNKTIYTQPAVMTVSYACYRILERRCREEGVSLNPYLMAGHSVGEYTAILVSGAIDLRTALQLIQKRATYMTESGKAYPNSGLMAIVDKNNDLDYDHVCSLCKDFGVYVTLNNTRNQIVVGGAKRRLQDLAKELKNEGKLATLLKVEGPFHTPIMKPAADKYRKELNKHTIRIASKPIMANVSAEAIVDPNHIRGELYEQIYKIVNWRGAVEKAIDNGGNLFLEVGPKKVLTNMIRSIDGGIPGLNVEDMESLEATVRALRREPEKPEKPEKVEKPEKPRKPEKPPEPEKPEKPRKSRKAKKPEEPEEPEAS
jgi:[acyl-carrier-protein] S-malonyltransferase